MHRGSKSIQLLLIYLLAGIICPGIAQSAGGTELPGYCEFIHVAASGDVLHKARPFFGIRYSDKSVDNTGTSSVCKTAVQVESVIAGSPAAKAGIEEKDIVTSINEKLVCGNSDKAVYTLRKILEEAGIGSTIKIGISRGEKALTVQAVLAEAPFHHMEEAEHDFSRNCKGESHLAKALKEQRGAALYGEIIEGLHMQSDAAVNPGWFYRDLHNLFQLREVTASLRYPLWTGEIARALTEKVMARTERPAEDITTLIKNSASIIDLALPKDRELADATLPNLLQAVVKANAEINSALENLSSEEQALIWEQSPKLQESKDWNRILQIALKVDLGRIISAVQPISIFLSKENLARLKKDLDVRFKDREEAVLFEESTPAGSVIVGGRGNNIYKEDAAVILDMGGDDVYLNNAGGTRKDMHVALVIDWRGDDLYQSREAYSQGSGVLGGGFLIDLGGYDQFSALDGSQGTGFFGLGIMVHGDGRSSLAGRRFCQGAGMMGIGLLKQRAGESHYLCGEYGQGVGLYRGLGMLYDTSGNDSYRLGGLVPDFRDPEKSTVSIGQGFGMGIRPEKDLDGVTGGIGILLDADGDDIYSADYFSQGGGYFYGFGILRDLKGNDRYLSGRYSQGAGIHTAVGVLIDQQGDDFYYAYHGVAQGMGHDYGTGLLHDMAGDDLYIGGTLVQAAATYGSMGMLFDPAGRDIHHCSSQCRAFTDNEKGMGIEIINAGNTGEAKTTRLEVHMSKPPESLSP